MTPIAMAGTNPESRPEVAGPGSVAKAEAVVSTDGARSDLAGGEIAEVRQTWLPTPVVKRR
jgi:hypothetical protein